LTLTPFADNVYTVKQTTFPKVAAKVPAGFLFPAGNALRPTVYQLNFSDQALAELKRLPKHAQLVLMEQISSIRPDELSTPADHMGRFSREGKIFHRMRAGEFRVYFEAIGETLYMHYILHQHSLADFVFRFKLPFTEETLIEQHQSFWKYLEGLKK
jgi:mRNA interferase RelE/StbE